MNMGEGMREAINAAMDAAKPWEMTAEETRWLKMAQNGNEGALCELLAALGLTDDERCAGFYAEIQGGEDYTFEEAQEESGLTTTEAAEVLECSVATVCNYRSRRTKPPREVFDRLAVVTDADRAKLAAERAKKRDKMAKVLEANKANITAADRREWQKKAVAARLRRRAES